MDYNVTVYRNKKPIIIDYKIISEILLNYNHF